MFVKALKIIKNFITDLNKLGELRFFVWFSYISLIISSIFLLSYILSNFYILEGIILFLISLMFSIFSSLVFENYLFIQKSFIKHNFDFYPFSSFGISKGISKNLILLSKIILNLNMEKEKLKSVLNSIDNLGIIVVNLKNSDVIFYNEYISKTFSLEGDYRGRSLLNLTPSFRINQLIYEENYQSKNVFLIDSKGTMKQFCVNKIKLDETILLVIQDITEIEELKSINYSILSIFSHEIRTPLTNLNLAIENLLQSSFPKENILKIIESNINRLNFVVSNVLAISEVKRSKLIRIEFNLKELCEKIVEHLLENYKEKQLKLIFNYTGKMLVNSDKDKLYLIFLNLLDNACKFSYDSGEISIDVRNTDETIELEISDRGIGIDKGDLEKIFTPFFRGKNSSQAEGSGLGLSIVKSLLDSLKGEVNVSSELNKGTSFKLIIPL